MENRLIMTIGLPRSGKSTWAKTTKLPVVNPDSIRMVLHGTSWRLEAEPMVWAIAKIMVASLFEAGHKEVVLDATNTTKSRRSEWKDGRWKRRYHPLVTGIDECLQRAVEDDRMDLIPIIQTMSEHFEPIDGSDYDV